MIDDAVCAAKREQLVALSNECQLPLEELDTAVQPIIDCCTKEAISVCVVFFTFFVVNFSISFPCNFVVLCDFIGLPSYESLLQNGTTCKYQKNL